MKKITFHAIALAACAALLQFTVATPAAAAVVTQTYIGTWSTTPVAPNPGMLARGGKYAIQVQYDDTSITALPSAEDDRKTTLGGVIDPARYFRAQLTTPASFQLFIPMQGFSGIVATQNATDHYDINANDCGGPCGFARTAEIQFFDAAGTQFRGFEFESDFLPGTTGLPGGGLIFEQFTSDVTLGPNNVTHSTAQIINGNNAFGVDVTSNTVDTLSQNAGPSGGQQNPGVFLSRAVDVVAAAGAALSYSASTLSLTTNAGTATVTDPVAPIVPGTVRTAPSAGDAQPRQADNDLGAGRSDGDDFLTYAWTVNGVALAANQTGTRLDRTVADSPSGPVFVNNATPRTVNDVNVAVGIAASGLTKTTDTVQWSVQVTEAITGLTSTDTVNVGYTNALPAVANATATASGPGNLDLDFALSGITDADLAVNALIAGFEALLTQIFVDGIDQSTFFANLISTGAQSVGNASLISQFGLGGHSFQARVTDLAGAFATKDFNFDVLAAPVTVPEPSSLALVGIAAAGLGLLGMRRRRSPVHGPAAA